MESTQRFQVGDLVEVAPRLFPGSNKHGGVGRIATIHPDSTMDIALLLGGRDNRVEEKYISAHNVDDQMKGKRVKKRRTLYSEELGLVDREELETERVGENVVRVAKGSGNAPRLGQATLFKSSPWQKSRLPPPLLAKPSQEKQIKTNAENARVGTGGLEEFPALIDGVKSHRFKLGDIVSFSSVNGQQENVLVVGLNIDGTYYIQKKRKVEWEKVEPNKLTVRSEEKKSATLFSPASDLKPEVQKVKPFNRSSQVITLPTKKTLVKDAAESIEVISSDSVETSLPDFLTFEKTETPAAIEKTSEVKMDVENDTKLIETTQAPALTNTPETQGTKDMVKSTSMEEEKHPTSTEIATTSMDDCSEVPTFQVGEVVHVASRTQPGMNKPGGVGRITKINEDGTYNVKYVIGGTEKHVPKEVISKDDASSNKRAAKSKAEQSISLTNIAESMPETSILQVLPLRAKQNKTPKKQQNPIVQSSSASTLQRSNGQDRTTPDFTLEGKPSSLHRHRVSAGGQSIPPPSIDLEPMEILQTGNPKEVARQAEFLLAVSSTFREMREESFETISLFDLVNKCTTKRGKPSFTQEEYQTRLETLNKEGKVMVHENTVYQV